MRDRRSGDVKHKLVVALDFKGLRGRFCGMGRSDWQDDVLCLRGLISCYAVALLAGLWQVRPSFASF